MMSSWARHCSGSPPAIHGITPPMGYGCSRLVHSFLWRSHINVAGGKVLPGPQVGIDEKHPNMQVPRVVRPRLYFYLEFADEPAAADAPRWKRFLHHEVLVVRGRDIRVELLETCDLSRLGKRAADEGDVISPLARCRIRRLECDREGRWVLTLEPHAGWIDDPGPPKVIGGWRLAWPWWRDRCRRIRPRAEHEEDREIRCPSSGQYCCMIFANSG